jgi:hypothetical protein
MRCLTRRACWAPTRPAYINLNLKESTFLYSKPQVFEYKKVISRFFE